MSGRTFLLFSTEIFNRACETTAVYVKGTDGSQFIVSPQFFVSHLSINIGIVTVSTSHENLQAEKRNSHSGVNFASLWK